MITTKRQTRLRPSIEIKAWSYMRLSAILLVPLVWIHAIFNTLLVGSENINLDVVTMRWANMGWRIYDILLLAFAFSHGVNGLRQVLFDFTSSSITRKALNILLLFYWLILSIIGAAAILGGIDK